MPFVLLLILEGGLRHAGHVSETWTDVTILDNLMTVLMTVILVPVIVAAYRLFMFGRQTVRMDAVDEFPTGTLAILGLSAVCAVALLPLTDMQTLMRHETAMMPSVELAYHAFTIAGWVFALLLIVRTGFLFNQAVLGRDLNISLAWRQTVGNGWRLFGLILLTEVPLLAIAGLVDTLTLEPLGGDVDFGNWFVWLGMLTQVLCILVVAITATAGMCLAYGHLTGFPLPAGRRDTPSQPSLPLDLPVP